jgi:nucleotide-binding universal stress UspA family protein
VKKDGVETVGEIVFATDFSDCSETAGRAAVAYARRLGARLHVLHVELARSRAAPQRLEALVRALGAPDGTVTRLRTGGAAEEIVKYAREVGAGLVVAGTHGRTGVSRALLGSVAERVARTAPCAVLVVPRGAPAARRKAAAPAPLPARLQKCLVCGTASPDLICEACRGRIRAEALGRKVGEERRARS